MSGSTQIKRVLDAFTVHSIATVSIAALGRNGLLWHWQFLYASGVSTNVATGFGLVDI